MYLPSAFSRTGVLTHKLCDIQFLTSCDYVIFIPGGGRTPVYRSHEQLMEMTEGEYATLVGNASQQQQQLQHPKQLTAPGQRSGE